VSNASYWDGIATVRVSRRRTLAGSAGLGTAFASSLLLGCGDSGGSKEKVSSGQIFTPRDTTSQAKTGGTLKDWQLNGDPSHFDSLAANAVGVNSEGYPTLLWNVPLKYPASLDGSIEGYIVESYELSPDKLQLTMRLRPGLKWDPRAPTSGRAIDAQDVVFSWQKFARLNPAATDLAFSRSKEAPVESITALDARSFQIKLVKPDASLLPSLVTSLRIHPRESDGGFDPRNVVRGYGPYFLEEYTPSLRLVWSKNPDFHIRGRPYIDKIERAVIPEPVARLTQFRGGNIYTNGVTLPDVIQTKKDLPQTVLFPSETYDNRQTYVSFGYEGNSPFKDTRVRQAMSMVIDRELFADVIEGRDVFRKEGLALPVASNTVVAATFDGAFLDPTNEKEFGPNHKYLKYNVAEAKKLLSAAGFGNGFDFQFGYNTDTNYSAPYLKVVEVLSGMWLDSGLKAKGDGIPYTQFVDKYHLSYALGNKHGFNGAMLRGGRGGGTSLLSVIAGCHPSGQVFHGMTPDGNNAVAGDPKVTDMIDKIRQEFDIERQNALFHDMIRYYTQQSYTIPRPSTSKSFGLYWPVLGNLGVWRPNGTYEWWIDATKPPLARA
jgi:peptide/nickel transport system substrate-binding protein